jgi:hypothetical protein
MNTNPSIFIFSVFVILLFSACAQQPVQPQPLEQSTSTPLGSGPEVTTAQPGSIINLQTPPPATPPPVPDTGGQKTITRDDQGKTINLKFGDNFLLQLGEEYTWEINISDTGVISRVKNIAVIRGAQGVYETLKTGTVTLTAAGDPVCRQAKPPCGMPSIQYQVTIVVQ